MCGHYLKILDRGGLKWPSEFTVSVCTSTYKMFQTLVGKYKESFFQSSNQRSVLVKLCLDYQENIDCSKEFCSCGTPVDKVLSLCIWSMSNILLNNFSKTYNNDIAAHSNCKKRKLSTLK